MKKIAIIGTGIMGAGMATNYLKNGYEVHVWNRGKERLGPLVELGAIEAASPKAAAQSVDIVFDVTANDEASRSVWLAEDGILAGAHAGSQLIASGTFSIPWTDELARECAKRGHIHFDIPLTGSRMGAEGGTMILLAGGDKKQFAALEPDLKAISQKVYYFGKSGSGMRFKLILNMLQAIHVAGLGEALRIAKASGMDVEAVGAALAERPGGVITNLAWNAYQNPPKQTNFSVKWIDKDLHYAKDFSGELPVPLLEGVLKHFDAALERGLGEDDWTASNT
jgi:3-hydroxyisobutyrate dehydrogenase-like beta-hydroxyacid dehydrogenase